MPVRQKTSTTRLPQILLDQIETTEEYHRRPWDGKPRASRKETRKQDRAVRKHHKANFFSVGTPFKKRPAEEDLVDSPKRKKSNHTDVQPTAGVRPVAKAPPSYRSAETPIRPLASGSKSSEKVMAPARKQLVKKDGQLAMAPRTQREEDEDLYIKHLERKLKHGKRGFEDDGLDDLLDFAESFTYLQPQDDAVTEDQIPSSSEESFDEWHGIEDENDSAEIFQAPPDANAANDARYIPPHLRHKPHEDDKGSEENIRLTKQLKGLLNRMSEQNMVTILSGVEDIYRDHKRNNVTSTLTSLVIDGIASHSSLLDSYVVLYAAFVSSLHKILGVEFAAHFIQQTVSSYELYHAKARSIQFTGQRPNADEQLETDTVGKECLNLAVLFSELYNFQVISSILIFDIIRGLLAGDLTEFGVELLLKIVRNSGQQLRQDDPSALTDIIQIVQNKVMSRSGDLSSRTRFMIETLNNLKNNKLKRNNQGGEAVERMKKLVSGLEKKRHVLAHEPLRVSLDDLHSAETKGKWWLVGAAWSGNPLVDRQENTPHTISNNHRSDDTDHNGLLTLAQKQGMNTEIRRSIFVVLMSSDDYVDACERLSQLNLTEVQQREIIRVLLHCCGNERSYNPYYTLVGQQLCRTSHSYKITLQFCLWDVLRDMGEASVGGSEVIKNLKDDEFAIDGGRISPTRLRNVAKAYAWWIAKDSVMLSVLKPIDFTLLKPQTRMFLKELMVQIFIDSQVGAPVLGSDLKVPTTRNRGAVEQIFIKATRNQALAMGLVYFMSETFRDVAGDDEDMDKLTRWASAVAKDTLRTGVEIIPTL